MAERLLTIIVKVVKGQVRHHAVPKLVADLAAVLCGLRPSLMLDYALLTPKIALELARQASLLGDCPLTVAQLADCTFFLRPDRYLPDAAPPLFIDFTSGTATWVEPGSERGTSLAGVAAEVRASVARRAVASGAPCLLTLDCDRWAARGAALPTLAGILLGYPAVYAIGSQEEGAQAARCLSSGGLVLHSLTAGLRAGRDPSPQAILAYSVPASLLPDTEMDERASAWEAEVRVAAAVAQGGVRLEKCWFCSSTCYPGHGVTFVRNDATVFRFCRSKCHKNFKMKRNPRKVKWTKAYRKLAGKDLAEDATFEMERKRNRPEKYDRELVHKAVGALKKVTAIRATREARLHTLRKSAARDAEKAADLRELEQSIHLIKAPGVLAREEEERLRESVEELQQTEAMQE